METIASKIQKAHEQFKTKIEPFRQWNCDVLAKHLEQLASMFERTNRDQHLDLIGQFHDCAGKLPYWHDEDFGALVLEATADNTKDKDLRAWLYTEARFRATWCAKGGTSGGETIARYSAVKRLDEKLGFCEVLVSK
jgi:hypothetical protein